MNTIGSESLPDPDGSVVVTETDGAASLSAIVPLALAVPIVYPVPPIVIVTSSQALEHRVVDRRPPPPIA